MPALEFTLKTLSPVFIAGTMEEDAGLTIAGERPRRRIIGPAGDGLRIPSLRGVLRFWYRTMHGGLPLQKLRESEGSIFGNTKVGQGLRLIPVSQSNWPPLILGRRDPSDLQATPILPGSALAYLGYGPINHVSRDVGASSYNKTLCREAIPPGELFAFRAIGTAHQLAELQRCLRLLHLFGGIGARSRRAWGSLAVIADFLPELPGPGEIVPWYAQRLQEIWSGQPSPSKLKKQPAYSAFSSDAKILLSSQAHDSYEGVMREFFDRFAAVRLYNWRNPAASPPAAQSDHDLEFRDSSNHPDVTGVPLRLAFGLPYHPQSRRRHWHIEYRGFAPGPTDRSRIDEFSRRASPLWLKVFENSSGKKHAAVLFLPANFFGRNDVEIGQDPAGVHKPFPGWAAVDDFLRNPLWDPVSLP